MSDMQGQQPFEQNKQVDRPGMIGASWWRDSRKEERIAATGRREALRNMLVAGGGLTVITASLSVFGVGCCDDDDEGVEYKMDDRSSLDVQKEYGWNFGSVEQKLTFDGTVKAAFDKGSLARMPTELSPSNAAYKPFYTPTLFQSPTALPRKRIEGQSPTTPLADALTPTLTPSMKTAYGQGNGLANLFKGKKAATAVIIDLPGPDAVAMAAGAASVLDPVFTFDNWPHPAGVVKAHMTLAAAAYYQPLFAKVRAARGSDALPAFVLDRDRLAAYADETKQFDNRYVAKLPPADQLTKMGIKRVLYVVPKAEARLVEIDDLNADFVAYEKAGIDVKMVAATDFQPNPSAKVEPTERAKLEEDDAWPPYYYGGDDGSDDGFWGDYGWSDVGGGADGHSPRNVSNTKSYAPSSRSTMFSSTSMAGGTTTKTSTGAGFATTAVAVAVGTGAVLGARHAASKWGGSSRGKSGTTRSGSFGRSGGRTSGG